MIKLDELNILTSHLFQLSYKKKYYLLLSIMKRGNEKGVIYLLTSYKLDQTKLMD